MGNYQNNKFEFKKIADGYELIYKDVETGIMAVLKLQPERLKEFHSRLQLVMKLVKFGVLEVRQFENNLEIQELFLY